MLRGKMMESGEIARAALKRLLKVLGDDLEELEELRNDYLEDAPVLAQRISDAAAQDDLSSLRIAAHTLKSNARDFGITRLADLCATVENDCLENALEDPVAFARLICDEEAASRRILSGICLADLEGPEHDI